MGDIPCLQHIEIQVHEANYSHISCGATQADHIMLRFFYN